MLDPSLHKRALLLPKWSALQNSLFFGNANPSYIYLLDLEVMKVALILISGSNTIHYNSVIYHPNFWNYFFFVNKPLFIQICVCHLFPIGLWYNKKIKLPNSNSGNGNSYVKNASEYIHKHLQIVLFYINSNNENKKNEKHAVTYHYNDFQLEYPVGIPSPQTLFSV